MATFDGIVQKNTFIISADFLTVYTPLHHLRKLRKEKRIVGLFIPVQHTKCYSSLSEVLPDSFSIEWLLKYTQNRKENPINSIKMETQMSSTKKIPLIVNYSFNIILFYKVAVKVNYLLVGRNTKPNAITVPSDFKRRCTMSKGFIPKMYLTFYFSLCLFVCVTRFILMKWMEKRGL